MALTTIRRRLSKAPPLLATVAVTACGGGSDATSDADRPKYDPDKLAEQSAAANPAARSGRVDGKVTLTLTGVEELSEPFSSSFTGPFQYREGAALPDYELDMGVRDYGAELSSVGGKSWITLGETGYPLPASVRNRLKRGSARGANGLTRTLEQFGIAPYRWETDRRFAGIERIDGVDVAHIKTSFSAGRMLKDANTLLGVLAAFGITRATGLPPQLTHRARRIVVSGVTLKQGESWVGLKDKVLRQAGFTLRFTIPEADRARLGGISGGTVVGELHVTEVGTPQQIDEPETFGSFSEFELALDALGEQQEAGG